MDGYTAEPHLFVLFGNETSHINRQWEQAAKLSIEIIKTVKPSLEMGLIPLMSSRRGSATCLYS